MKPMTSPFYSLDPSLAVMHCTQTVLCPVLHIYWGCALVPSWRIILAFFLSSFTDYLFLDLPAWGPAKAVDFVWFISATVC